MPRLSIIYQLRPHGMALQVRNKSAIDVASEQQGLDLVARRVERIASSYGVPGNPLPVTLSFSKVLMSCWMLWVLTFLV